MTWRSSRCRWLHCWLASPSAAAWQAALANRALPLRLPWRAQLAPSANKGLIAVTNRTVTDLQWVRPDA